ncbi:hypothetical protein UA08_00452 [Talaromyces atroroseus]|uniref:Uncharacterized protein n=1 Tax=Talaromyces atroroseus TaxID=1441469 RepID=A0A225AQI6_TALAT|nr:hypothetical protein UA08_00452 [Talaromyces atroroseus]OKL63882.1 hypothetical protein UA08_00452 [Talaromyces atroroseus]
MTEAPKYSLDSQPTWLPAGWDMEKAMDMTPDEWDNLSKSQQDVLRAGFEAHCGTEFQFEVFKDMSERSQIKADTYVSQAPITRPNFMQTLERYYASGDWGFVFYRTTYAQDEEQWSLVQTKMSKMIERNFDYNSVVDGVNEARQRWKLHWIENPQKFDGMAPHDVATHYRSVVKTLPRNYQHSICFVVDEASARSILLADASRTEIRPLLGDIVPFVIAIDRFLGWENPDAEKYEDEEDLGNWRGPFRAHPGSIVEDIFDIVGSQLMETHEFAYSVRGTNNVWWNSCAGVWTVDGEGRYAERLFESAALLRAEYRQKKRREESS